MTEQSIVVVRAIDHHRYVPDPGFWPPGRHQPGNYLKAVFFGHPKIEHKNIWNMPVIELAGLRAVNSFGYELNVIFRSKNGGEAFPNNWVIVRN